MHYIDINNTIIIKSDSKKYYNFTEDVFFLNKNAVLLILLSKCPENCSLDSCDTAGKKHQQNSSAVITGINYILVKYITILLFQYIFIK